MNTSLSSPWVHAGLLALALSVTGCMQPGLSRAALDLQARRDAARQERVQVEPVQVERVEESAVQAARKHKPTASRPTQVTLHGYVLSSVTQQAFDPNIPLVVFVERKGLDANKSGDPALGPLPVAHGKLGDSDPSFVVTSPGEGVRFENVDDICHSFFSSSGPNAFDLGVLNPGESRRVDFQQAGTVQVYCTLHEGKQINVLVAPTPFHTRVNADGSFAIPGLDPGEYMMTAWGAGLKARQRRVQISDTEPEPILIDLEVAERQEGE